MAADANTVFRIKRRDTEAPAEQGPNLVVVTHGWIETKPWPRDLAAAIKAKTTDSSWYFGWYDWREDSKRINPADAARFAKEIGGPLLGEKIVALSKDWCHVHLIGHSAGSWLISEAAKIIAKETGATIHLTFLDAYVPHFLQENRLGDFLNDPNASGFCDHYFTKDLTLGATQKVLPWAHNVDLTKITPGLQDHEFPRYWYHATVIGQYQPGQRYAGKKLFYRHGKIHYGFHLALEAGKENFKLTAKLQRGGRPVVIKKPKKSFEQWLSELFKKPQ